jgi:hypothetical protein
VAAILHNGLGRYADAFAAAGRARDDCHLYVSMWALPELIEAAVRTRNTEVSAGALERLAESTSVSGTDWALGIEVRSRALLSITTGHFEIKEQQIRNGEGGAVIEVLAAKKIIQNAVSIRDFAGQAQPRHTLHSHLDK